MLVFVWVSFAQKPSKWNIIKCQIFAIGSCYWLFQCILICLLMKNGKWKKLGLGYIKNVNLLVWIYGRKLTKACTGYSFGVDKEHKDREKKRNLFVYVQMNGCCPDFKIESGLVTSIPNKCKLKLSETIIVFIKRE